MEELEQVERFGWSSADEEDEEREDWKCRASGEARVADQDEKRWSSCGGSTRALSLSRGG
ncbi:hypothetical protein PI124_g16921 [Phytophthora idaei]|nr:hypothetical protein PI126_g10551 [Phytophthora idaei]KAG3238104.1 hypothetical protein PI124_g16921 [Phytophthora idaei]